MAKVSSIQKNLRRERMVKKFAGRRDRLKAVANDRSASPEDRFKANLKLAELGFAIVARLPDVHAATIVSSKCLVSLYAKWRPQVLCLV
jgi:hypothetical protein